MSNPSVSNMISAIVKQIDERFERGTLELERDLATLQHQFKTAQQLAEPALEADVDLLLGKILFSFGENPFIALEHFTRANDNYKTAQRIHKAAHVLMLMSGWHNYYRQPEKALTYAQLALDNAKESGNFSLTALSYCQLGAAHNNQKDYVQAQASYEQASEVLKEASITRRRGELILQIEYGMGLNLMRQQKFTEAWEYVERLYHLATAYADHLYQIRGSVLMAETLLKSHRPHERDVPTYIKEAHTVIEQTKRLPEKPAVLEIEAAYWTGQGDSPAATRCYQEALQFYERTSQAAAAGLIKKHLVAISPAAG